MPFKKAALVFGDIVLVPFPFTDQTTTKKRPAIVISCAAHNSTRPDIILMAVTSQLRATAALGEVWLTEWQAAGLLKPSTAKPVIATIERSLVIKKLGSLATTDETKLRVAVRQILDFE